MRLLLATHNAHKLRELRELLEPCIALDPLPNQVELPPETGETFAANALGKARAASAACGRPAIADDSGIEAAALGGAPGIFSARFAGQTASDGENLAKLRALAPPGSALEYVCVIAWVDATSEHLFEGRCTGTLLSGRPRGSGGFGYDPAFLPDDGPPGLTMAELSAAAKHQISHRGRAARKLLAWI
ncbi:MAG: non-canonical purine NTP pyrophosphatase [Solirubrobacteraceae bacterium]